MHSHYMVEADRQYICGCDRTWRQMSGAVCGCVGVLCSVDMLCMLESTHLSHYALLATSLATMDFCVSPMPG